ncbi:MAG: two pore domain potassium channel family protein [Phenylobacterium sp.]|uniref:two pore domain potassium channel family protein n=1 Tax=Phenylobacterium sp. TaxID=1871053 RepID=UPI00391C4D1E
MDVLASGSNLGHELLLATAMVGLTVVVHLIGLDVLMDLTRWRFARLQSFGRLDRMLAPLTIVLGLFVLHGLEIWAYAAVYWSMGLLPSLEQALYFSTSAYSTVGETGAILPVPWRIVGVLEAVNGMLLIGWSTAFLFQVLTHLMEEEEDARQLPRGAIARSSPRRNGSGKGSPSATKAKDTELMQ